MVRFRKYAAALCLIAPGLLSLSGPSLAQTGTAVPSLAVYDELVAGLLRRHQIPGAALAVTRGGRLVLARGYGVADAASGAPVQPVSLFRIASLSKAITAVAVMTLVEDGKLRLDDPAFALLEHLERPVGTAEDPRLANITVRHLLHHSGGWDKDVTFDPVNQSPIISAALRVAAPASAENVIRAMRSQPLQFAPGTRFSYSNFGYTVLGRIIERASGMSYEQYVRTRVLAPLGISRMRIGNTLEQGRLPDEVRYHYPLSGPSVFPNTEQTLPMAYGGSWDLESKDAAGGWLASAIDYVKFLNGVDGRRGRRLLSPESIAAMTARPDLPEYQGSVVYYAFGLQVRPIGNQTNWWHGGGSDGTLTFQLRAASGYTWVLLLNASPISEAERAALINEMDRGLAEAVTKVTSWPSNDLFADYPDTTAEEFASMPAIATREGVANAASGERGIVSGSWLTIAGVNLAGSARTAEAEDGAERLPLELDGVEVKIGGQLAALAAIAPERIVAQAPEGLSPGWVPVEVIRNGVSSGVVLTHARHHAPGLYAEVTALDGSRIGNGGLAEGARAAVPGETIVLRGTGFVPSPAGVRSVAPEPVGGVAIRIGDRMANVVSCTLAGPGLFEARVVVPELADGEYALQVTVNGNASGVSRRIPVRR